MLAPELCGVSNPIENRSAIRLLLANDGTGQADEVRLQPVGCCVHNRIAGFMPATAPHRLGTSRALAICFRLKEAMMEIYEKRWTRSRRVVQLIVQIVDRAQQVV